MDEGPSLNHNGGHETDLSWYEALVSIADRHNNVISVSDFEYWTLHWKTSTPEEAFYDEFPMQDSY